MVRTLIVDDERWVVERLAAGIPWEAEGFQVVGKAYDGEEALRLIAQLEPQVVFTDIRMPVLGGLDLICETRRRGIDVAFVVISGYAEFAYAQKALQYGVAAYCLKPVETEEVVGILRRVRAGLETRSRRWGPIEDQITAVADSESGQAMLDLLRSAGHAWKEGVPIRVLVRDLDAAHPALEKAALVSARIGSRKQLSILTEEAYAAIRDKLRESSAGRMPVGASQPVTRGADLHRAIVEAIVAYNHRFMGTMDELAEYHADADPPALRSVLRAIEEAVGGRDAAALSEAFRALREALTRAPYTTSHASFLYNSIVYFVSRAEPQLEEPLVEPEDLVDLFDDVAGMLEYLQEIAQTAARGQHREPIVPGPMDELIRYVDEHLLISVSLSDLCRRFQLSPSHLSRLFKRRTGVSLTEYITRERIRHARELLRTTSLPVGDVAEESGYDSYFYFARVFRRVVGCTPSAYRAAKSADDGAPPGEGGARGS